MWHWDDEFTPSEKEKIEAWLSQTHEAIGRFAGPLPFDVHVHLEHHSRGGEPVPWANTWRAGEQSIFFYVDTSYSLDEFLADWTAPHEFSHLYLPYLGRENSWVAEGFASYLQHTIMVEMGVIDEPEARKRRDRKMRAAMEVLDTQELPLPDSMASLRSQRRYSVFYWGGAVYWERVDARLQSEGSSLQTVLSGYLDCCRMQRRSLDELGATLDRVGDTLVFSEELAVMAATPGCPSRPGAG